jgi:hypothetical protein
MRSQPTTTTALAPAARALPGWAAPALVFLGACLVYAINLDRLPHPDELYQILPAEGLLATGEPRLADGLYTRAYAQTWLIAQSIRLFGDSLPAARLSSVLGVAAAATLLFVWLRGAAGAGAAWLGAVGYALSPMAVDTAQFARIYGVQTGAFTLACVLAYAALAPATRGGRGRRLALLALALPPLVLAAHLQPTTLFGAAGLGLWGAGALALPFLADPAVPPRRKRAGLAAVAALGLVLVAGAWASGLLGELWREYRSTPIFNQANRNEFWFYHGWFSLLYPSLWPLTGVLALAALAASPRPAAMALAVFAVGFLLNSFGASKALRYIAYAQPFLFALWGMGLAALWRQLAAVVSRLAADLAASLPALLAGPAGGRRLARFLVGGAVLFLLLANPAWVRTVTLLADVPVPGEEPSPDWAAARPALDPLLDRVPVVVTTEELGAQYYLGRFDVRFSPSKLGELPEDQRREFAPDPRTGRPVVSTVESLRLIFDCHPEGLFLLASRQWGREHLFNEAVRRLILERAERVPLPPRARVTAYAWKRPDGAPRPAACATIPPLPGPAARTAGH